MPHTIERKPLSRIEIELARIKGSTAAGDPALISSDCPYFDEQRRAVWLSAFKRKRGGRPS